MKLYRWYNHRIKYFYRNFIYGIKNLWKWFPIIWNDRDFDHYYIWEVLKFKLSKQSAYLKKRNTHDSTERSVERMKLCITLINRIKTEYYTDEFHSYYEDKLIFTPIQDTKSTSLSFELVSERYKEYFDKYSRIYKQVITMRDPPYITTNTKFGIGINMGLINHNRAKKLLYKILEQNLEQWWD